MFERRSSQPEPRSSGARLLPPAVPPAPPAGPPGGPPRLPGGEPVPPPPPDGSAFLRHDLEECLGDLAFIRVSLETLEVLDAQATPSFSLDLWSQIEEGRMRLMQRLQEIDRQVCRGPHEPWDHELLGFQQAMLDLFRRGVSDELLEASGLGPLMPPAESPGRFHYALALRGPFDDPSEETPTALLRRVLDDLENVVFQDDTLSSLPHFDQAVSRRLLAVLFACYVGESPLLK